MPLTGDHLHRMLRVIRAGDANFVELVGLAELDPAEAFQGAALRGVDLRGQDLGGFDFSGADFAGADLRGADLLRSRGVTPDMLSAALYDSSTRLPPDVLSPFWAPGRAPSWASDWGIDAHGRWVAFGVPAADGSRVTQRMRWIPPGRFTIGSPNDEPGRYGDEGPQQEVTIATGYWLFDTPCTQALWQAVTGKNPSNFQSPARPVEQVSFNDVRQFLRRINARVPGLNLSLPSEAQWEYACRAGTPDATYAGAIEIVSDYNAPVLDAIAWYGGNSGVGFELDNGYDSSGWPGKQHEHTKAGTHPVGQKAPNAWGLYDMLGNVWEWCADQWHGSYEDVPLDGSIWGDPRGAALRVIRGGSWGDGARSVRASCRGDLVPDRLDYLGFRCARVQDSEQRPAERRAGRSKPSERSETAATTGPKRRR